VTHHEWQACPINHDVTILYPLNGGEIRGPDPMELKTSTTVVRLIVAAAAGRLLGEERKLTST